MLQIASYELGKLLPKDQRPLPLDLMRIGDSRSDVVPNGGRLSQQLPQLPQSCSPPLSSWPLTNIMYRFGSNCRMAVQVFRDLDTPQARACTDWTCPCRATSEAAVASVSEACKQLVKNLAPHTQVPLTSLTSSFRPILHLLI